MKKTSNAATGKIVMMLSPQYLNYGDHAIALAETACINKFLSPQKICDINYTLYKYWPEKVKKYIHPDDCIVVTGGGYIGNLWPENQKLVEQILEQFPNNRIIFAPQTIFYSDEPNATAERTAFTKKLENHENFFFFGRDMQSCEQMKEMGFIPGDQYAPMPDFVLLMPEEFDLDLKSEYAAICLRSDKEARADIKKEVEDVIKDQIPGKLKTIIMAQDHVEIPVTFRRTFVGHKLQQFAKASVVVTDRLHGMLYSAYTGTPCVAFDNTSKKVSGVYEWIKELEYIAIAEDISQLPVLLERVTTTNKKENRRAFIACREKLAAKYLPIFNASLR